MKKLLVYSLHEKKNAEKCKIIQKLWGYNDNSNKGQYRYKRKGLLDGLNYKKVSKTILFFDAESERKKAINIFKKMKIKFLLADT